MKTEEDEAIDDIARKQGSWGGGFPAKRKMAADKQEPWNEDEWRRNNWRCSHGWLRGEQCEICNAAQEPYDQTALELCNVCGWKTLIPDDGCLNCERAQSTHGVLHASDSAAMSDALTIAYQSGYYDGKKAALAGREWNFCERCGKRTADKTVIHTCTPPQEKNND